MGHIANPRSRGKQVGRGITVSAPPAVFHRMKWLPYGRWICADGREVLYNRFYQPIWQRRPGGPVEEADLDEFVHGIVGYSGNFYNDGTCDKEGAARRALREWISR